MLYGAITRAGLKLMLWCLFCAQLKTIGQLVKTLREEGKMLKEQNQQLIQEQRKRGRVVDKCQAPHPPQTEQSYSRHALVQFPSSTTLYGEQHRAQRAERSRLSTTCSYRRDGSPNCSASWVGVEKRWTS